MRKTIAGEEVQDEISSREGTVYMTARYVYKVFGSRTNPYDELVKYKTAETRGVPVADTAKFTAQLRDGARSETIDGLRSRRASGRFFQLSKAGGERILINEINLATDRELLKIIISGLKNAGQLGVTDPQGFINVNSNPPLTFIDLHYRGTPNFVAFQGVSEAAETKLKEMG